MKLIREINEQVEFITESAIDESGKKISHWSKYYRGLLARWIILNEKGDPLQVRNATLPSCHID